MHSWVFRHRARLRVIFGVADEVEAEPPETQQRRGARRLKPSHRPQRKPRGTPGTVVRGARNVTLRPMGRPES